MQEQGLARYAPLAGILFLVLIVASIILGGEPPDVDDSTADAVEYWKDDDSVQIASAIVGAYAALALLWFGGSLRNAIVTAEAGTGRLASLAFAGVVTTAIGGLANCALQLAAADTAGDVPGEVTQTISVLYADFFFPVAVGIALMLLATGLAALRYAVLPRWLAIVSLVLGVLAVTPVGFFVFLIAVLWVAFVSVLLFRAQTPPAAPAAATAP